MMLDINGSAMPVPAPCSSRATISIGKFNVHAAIRQPAMHSRIAVRKMFFSGYLRFRYEDSGVTRETISGYPVVNHWMVDVSTWNSAMSSGNSTLVRVSVRMPMNAMMPIATMESTRVGWMRSSLFTRRSFLLPGDIVAVVFDADCMGCRKSSWEFF